MENFNPKLTPILAIAKLRSAFCKLCRLTNARNSITVIGRQVSLQVQLSVPGNNICCEAGQHAALDVTPPFPFYIGNKYASFLVVCVWTEVLRYTCSITHCSLLSCVCDIAVQMEVIDSCTVNNGGCDQQCTHGRHGPICSCHYGYVLLSDRTSCQGIELTIVYD